jgi:hypothetical protein
MRIKWSLNRAARLRQIAQLHLRPGWSQQRVEALLAAHGLTDWNHATDAQIEALLATVG